MIIGIDATRAQRTKRTGTEWYTAKIIQHLANVATTTPFWLYTSADIPADLQNLPKNFTWKKLGFPLPKGWTLFRLGWEMITNPPSVLFLTSFAVPLIGRYRSVVVVHDLGFDHFPHLYKRTDIIYHRFMTRLAARRAAHFIVPSEFTKYDLHKRYHVPLKKITTIYLGFEDTEFRAATKDEPRLIKEPYFYFISRLEARKNVVRLIEAFGDFKAKTGLPHKLVLAGQPCFGYDTITTAIAALGEYKTDVVLPGYVSQTDATHYLRQAEALVYPSLFEGFGLPVLEAFASATPVITSNTTSLPEVAGEAALLVNPLHTEEISVAMQKIAQDKNLRQELIKKGIEQYQRFSWDKTASETEKVLRKVAEKHPHTKDNTNQSDTPGTSHD